MNTRLLEGIRLHEQGRFHEAAAIYQQILQVSPKHADALNLMGQCCLHLGAYDDAARYIKRCLKLKPAYAPAHRNLGDVLYHKGDKPAALDALKRSLALDPAQEGIHVSIGTILQNLRRYEESLIHCRQAVAADPLSAHAHNALGLALYYLGQIPEAESALRRALELAPDFALAHNNLGLVLKHLGRGAEAAQCFRAALTHDPACVSAYANLAITEGVGVPLQEAEMLCRKALEFDPNFSSAHLNLGGILQQQGRSEEAEHHFERVIRSDPENLDACSNWLFVQHLIKGRSPAHAIERARQYGKAVSALVDRRFTSWNTSPTPEKLRVGFVSGDLRNHPVGYFLESVLSHMDMRRFELFAYPTSETRDDLTERLRPRFAAWRPLAELGYKQSAELIRSDGIHVLIDLSGHTECNRLPLFAWKPAPVQATWLGYFATTGIAEIDYLIADEVGVPESDRSSFTEQVFYLPETRLCYTPPGFDIAVSELPANANGFITFGCFQNRGKINDDVLAVWARILAAVPGARLRLQSKQYDDPAVIELFKARFAQAGGDVSRLSFVGVTPRREYLLAHNEVDVILDTFPYPGGTTTCDALWMGVPTITLAGNSLLARQGASLMAAAGLAEWIARDENEYSELAMSCAKDLPGLAALRSALRPRVLVSPLFDAQRFAGVFGNALWTMWQEKGLPRARRGA